MPPFYGDKNGKTYQGKNNNNNNVDWSAPHRHHANIAQAPLPTRNRFIAKVYTILFIQLCFTAVVGVVFWVYLKDSEFIKEYGQYLYIGAAVGTGACCFILCCCANIVRAFPMNYIFLFVLTSFMSITVGFVSSHHKLSDVAVAFGITAGLFLSLSIIAVTIKKDITGWGTYLFIAMIVLMGFSLVIFGLGAFTQLDENNKKIFKWLHIGISIAVVIISSFGIVYDTQLIVGGENRKFSYSTDDYCLAAISLYFDIINIFMAILQLLGST